MTNNTPAPADLVEAVKDALRQASLIFSPGHDPVGDYAQAAITAMQAYLASDGVTQMDRDLYAKILRSLGHEAFAQDAADGVDDDDEPLHDIAAHRRAAAITPQPDSIIFRPMGEWDKRDEVVLLLVDYSNDGHHPLDDAERAITIGHNNDHNVGEGEGEGWQFAGWSWQQDCYTEGKGEPIGWAPLPHHLATGEAPQPDPRDVEIERLRAALKGIMVRLGNLGLTDARGEAALAKSEGAHDQ